jgi:1-acyl-sn-glycerol-3-phosphate acyltransferase
LIPSLALAAFALFFLYVFRRRGPEDTLFLAFLRAVGNGYSRVFHRLRRPRPGEDPVPPEGACIVVANHRSGIDPLLLCLLTRRRIRFLMAREYYEIPILHWMFRALGCIPVNRNGNDLGATKAALRVLREGKVIGIFPQGGIREASDAPEGKSGTALLAIRTRAPVVPFLIEGSPNFDSVLRAFLTPSKTRVRWGAPVKFGAPGAEKPTRAELDEVTASILKAIWALRDEGPTRFLECRL